jgi:DNA (cytosine-5)-methyltransferase 1
MVTAIAKKTIIKQIRTKQISSKLKFIDLFAGIGGVRTAFTNNDFECVFSSDWDKYAQISYEANYGEKPFGDITQVDTNTLPDFDILCGGFPCQPFSIAGVSKKNSLGKKHGFEDEKQGHLFFEVARIIKNKNPGVIFLENVKNLLSHDKGNTWKVVKQALTDLGYELFTQIIDAKYYVPQHRERIFIVGFNKLKYPNIDFKFPEYPKNRIYELRDIIENEVDAKYTLSDKLWSYLQKHKEKSKANGKGFGFGLIDPISTEYTRTMSARYYKDGSEILISQKNKNPRRLTPREAAKLQGFPDTYKVVVSDNQAYKQFGNSVAIPAISATALKIKQTLLDYSKGGSTKINIPLF